MNDGGMTPNMYSSSTPYNPRTDDIEESDEMGGMEDVDTALKGYWDSSTTPPTSTIPTKNNPLGLPLQPPQFQQQQQQQQQPNLPPGFANQMGFDPNAAGAMMPGYGVPGSSPFNNQSFPHFSFQSSLCLFFVFWMIVGVPISPFNSPSSSYSPNQNSPFDSSSLSGGSSLSSSPFSTTPNSSISPFQSTNDSSPFMNTIPTPGTGISPTSPFHQVFIKQ